MDVLPECSVVLLRFLQRIFVAQDTLQEIQAVVECHRLALFFHEIKSVELLVLERRDKVRSGAHLVVLADASGSSLLSRFRDAFFSEDMQLAEFLLQVLHPTGLF